MSPCRPSTELGPESGLDTAAHVKGMSTPPTGQDMSDPIPMSELPTGYATLRVTFYDPVPHAVQLLCRAIRCLLVAQLKFAHATFIPPWYRYRKCGVVPLRCLAPVLTLTTSFTARPVASFPAFHLRFVKRSLWRQNCSLRSCAE